MTNSVPVTKADLNKCKIEQIITLHRKSEQLIYLITGKIDHHAGYLFSCPKSSHLLTSYEC